MGTTDIFLIAMLIIFSLPYLVWRGARTEYYAPLVVVQIIAGIVLGVLALKEIKRQQGISGRGLAIAGIVLGTVFALLALVAILLVTAWARHSTSGYIPEPIRQLRQ